MSLVDNIIDKILSPVKSILLDHLYKFTLPKSEVDKIIEKIKLSKKDELEDINIHLGKNTIKLEGIAKIKNKNKGLKLNKISFLIEAEIKNEVKERRFIVFKIKKVILKNPEAKRLDILRLYDIITHIPRKKFLKAFFSDKRLFRIMKNQIIIFDLGELLKDITSILGAIHFYHIITNEKEIILIGSSNFIISTALNILGGSLMVEKIKTAKNP